MKKYMALRFVATLFKICGVVFVLLGIGALFGALSRQSGLLGQLAPGYGLAGFVISLLAGIFFYAYGELIYVFMDIEENTSRRVESPAPTASTLGIADLSPQRAVITSPLRPVCESCGAALEPNSEFCSNCGDRLVPGGHRPVGARA